MTRGPLAASLLLAGCTLVTNFDPSRTAEVSDRLCSDGLDNDGDGFADCQDWDCLKRRPCCTLDVVVYQDSFDAQACALASCQAPDQNCAIDGSRWEKWGQPEPVLCEGALRPLKPGQCYDVGVLGTAPLAVRPGLGISAHVKGRPEMAGRLEMSLTLQEHAVGGLTQCEPFQPIAAFAALRLVRSANGSVALARFEQRDLGTSAELLGEGPHELRLNIDSERRLSFHVNGQKLAQTEPLPATPVTARLALSGRGLAAGFDDVRVTDGTQCEDPAAWSPAPVLVLEGAGDHGRPWDSFQVYAPSVARWPAGGERMLYTGCANGTATNQCTSTFGVGQAMVGGDGLVTRDTAHNPLALDVSRTSSDPALVRNSPTVPAFGYLTATDIVSSFAKAVQSFSLEDKAPGEMSLDLLTQVVRIGPPGSWDDANVCCPSVLWHEGRLHLYYAGQSSRDGQWRIGLALSDDGRSFVKYPGNPVLSEGTIDSFDARGVSDPEVLWDSSRRLFRLWYAGLGFLGTTAIGYAVSTDGRNWSRFPANPVITRTSTGLEQLSGPGVLDDANGYRLWMQAAYLGRPGLRIFRLENRGAPFRDPP